MTKCHKRNLTNEFTHFRSLTKESRPPSSPGFGSKDSLYTFVACYHFFMLLRSHSLCSISNTHNSIIGATYNTDAQTEILRSYLRNNDKSRKILGGLVSCWSFNQPPRSLQIDPVLSLARNQDTVLLASTGYGKGRIAELFNLSFSRTLNRWKSATSTESVG